MSEKTSDYEVRSHVGPHAAAPQIVAYGKFPIATAQMLAHCEEMVAKANAYDDLVDIVEEHASHLEKWAEILTGMAPGQEYEAHAKRVRTLLSSLKEG